MGKEEKYLTEQQPDWRMKLALKNDMENRQAKIADNNKNLDLKKGFTNEQDQIYDDIITDIGEFEESIGEAMRVFTKNMKNNEFDRLSGEYKAMVREKIDKMAPLDMIRYMKNVIW